MTFFTLIESTLNAILDKLFGTNKTPYVPQRVRSQNQPSNKLAEALRDAEVSKKSR